MSEFTVDKYTVLKLERSEKFGFGLMEGFVGQDGEWRPSTCKREFGKKGERVEKKAPVSIKMGMTVDMVRDIAVWLLEETGGAIPKETEDEPPF